MLLHLSWHPNGSYQKQQFWLEESTRRVRRYAGYTAAWNHKNCMDLGNLRKSEGNQALGNRVCISLYDDKMMSIYLRVS